MWTFRAKLTILFNDNGKGVFKRLKALVSARIIVAPAWSLPIELTCDANDFTVGDVLGQRKHQFFHSIYYGSRTLNDTQLKYTTIQKKFLVVIFAFNRFRSYFIGSKVTM